MIRLPDSNRASARAWSPSRFVNISHAQVERHDSERQIGRWEELLEGSTGDDAVDGLARELGPWLDPGCDLGAQLGEGRARGHQLSEHLDVPRLQVLPVDVGRDLEERREVGGLGDGGAVALHPLSADESSTKVLLHCRTRFWETEYGIAGGASHSDLLFRALYYPSDNAVAVTEPVPSRKRFNTMYGGYENGEFAPSDPSVSQGPGVLLASYTWGQDARRLGQLSPEERVRVVTQQIARIHPEVAEPGMVDDFATMFWDSYPWTNASFAELLPGQQSSIHDDAMAPEGAVHFAGEHTSLDTGWIHGAISSAFRAVHEIVTRPD
ncbi:MAG: hypothetical protein FJW86_13275 [Actinobacteria bacterium]|nr:hypothetical protein [Actinomycetota bacterium]